jgi:peptidoglycan/LPS O-acetylase OafA/YrhL
VNLESQRRIFTVTGAVSLGFAAGGATVAALALPRSPPVPEWAGPVRLSLFAAVALVMLAGVGQVYAEWVESQDGGVMARTVGTIAASLVGGGLAFGLFSVAGNDPRWAFGIQPVEVVLILAILVTFGMAGYGFVDESRAG